MSHSESKELKQADHLMREGKINEALQIILELEKRDDFTHQELLSIKLFKANLLYKLGDLLGAINYAEDIFQEFQKQGNLLSSFDTLIIQAYAHGIMGNVSQSEDIIKQAEDLFKIVKETFTIDLRERESFLVRIKANIHYFKGEIQPSLELNKKAYELAKDTSNKELISASLSNIADKYKLMKEYDKAIMYAKEVVKVNYKPILRFPLSILIETYIKKGDIKEAKVYLDKLHEIKEEYDTKRTSILYRYNNALLLKSSLRARNRIKSEDIFKEIAMDNTLPIEQRYDAIINLCDLFLIELRITNDPEILDEIQPFIQELLYLAEHHHLYVILAETYLLQAKFSLLTSDIKKAKRFITQAQKISERFGYKELKERITNEQSKLLKQSDIWEKLKEMGAPMDERIKLAHLNEHIEEIIEKRAMLPAFITEEKVAIHKEKKICLVCRGEVLRFSYICECGAIYCDNCARALTNLENVCWVCDNPIDYLKPVKPYTEEEEINVDNKGKK